MAAHARNPLSFRPHTHHQSVSISPCQTVSRKPTAVKRPRSPEPTKDEIVPQSIKRFKPVVDPTGPSASREETKKEKERRRAEREEEFRIKYRRAFPNFVFYFDLDTINTEIGALRVNLERRVLHLGAVCT